ncbi:hypothetical protein [Devosia sp. 2618]|uniref:hypothetical protein n=1 Tax=Devosia sp. 2618 TaxID=3156454 RepID=UPI00339A02C7
MKILLMIVGLVLLGFGVLWTLQGANVMAGSAMSGQSQWLYIGILVGLAGIATLWWTYRHQN